MGDRDKIPYNFDALPAELRKIAHWCLFRLVWDEKAQKFRKVPQQVRAPEYGASSKDPDHWATFEQAVAAYEKRVLCGRKNDSVARDPQPADGIGWFFTPPFFGYDLDHVRDKETGEVDPIALDWIQRYATYTEISISGTGYHGIGHGTAPSVEDPKNPLLKKPIQHKGDKIEVYASERFFTVTGWHLQGTPNEVVRFEESDVAELYRRAKELDDKKQQPAILQARRSPTRTERVLRLSLGDWQELYTSQSDADFEYCCFLAEANHGDVARVEADFRRSTLYRSPAQGKHEGYPAITAKKAVDKWLQNPKKNEQVPDDEGLTVVKKQSYDQIPKEHLRYLWPGYLPLGKLVHSAGNSTEGKSPVKVDLSARISRGADWPDGTKNTLGPRSVILLAAEDDPNDTVRPRLELAEADISKVFRVTCSLVKGQTQSDKLLALDHDIDALIAEARTIPDLALVIIDPITNYLGNVKMNKEEDVRPVLMKLLQLAKDLNICVNTVGHFNRREKGTDSLHRIMGAAAFGGVARFIYLFGPDPEDADKYAHIMVQKRGVGKPTLRYKTEAIRQEWDGESSEVIRVAWRGKSEATAEDAVDPASHSERSKTVRAAAEVQKILKNGKMRAEEAKKMLKDSGFELEKLNLSRVLEKAGAESARLDGEKFYTWYLKALF